jgi:hypothetical protein
VGVAAFLTFRPGPGDGLVASGTVEATTADLGFNVPGRSEAVLVREGEVVPQATCWPGWTRRSWRLVSARRAQADAARAVLAELEAGARARR